MRGDHPNSWKNAPRMLGQMKISHVGSHQFRESLRELLRELFLFVLLKSWDAISRMENRIPRMEFRIPRAAPRIPRNFGELEEWPFHSESVFPEIGWKLKGVQTMKCKLWTETLEFLRLKVPNSRFAPHGLAPPKFTVCAPFLPLIHGLCAFFRLLLTPLSTAPSPSPSQFTVCTSRFARLRNTSKNLWEPLKTLLLRETLLVADFPLRGVSVLLPLVIYPLTLSERVSSLCRHGAIDISLVRAPFFFASAPTNEIWIKQSIQNAKVASAKVAFDLVVCSKDPWAYTVHAKGVVLCERMCFCTL